jgi:iron complex outermembrane receptor protein
MSRALLLSATLLASPVWADDEGRGPHLDPNPEIVVTAPFPRETFFVLSGVSVLTDVELARELRPTIGETLARQPGVSSSYFGPNAARPVLRGLQGERVRVLSDGIGSFDVSNTSVDHAVAISPFAAERIEVVRGPEVLLYGSSAIGGVVNSLDRRIPRALHDEPIHIDAQGGFASAASEKSFAGSADARIAPGFMVHVDGSFLDTRDLRVGDFVLSRAVREAAAAAGLDPEEFEMRDRLDNTAARTWNLSAGFGWFFGEDSSAGVSVTRLESRYGVPNRIELEEHEDEEHEDGEHEGEEHEDEHGDIMLDMRQTRVDARLDLGLGDGFISRVKLRGGYADYIHDEIEGSGEIGTTFFSTGGEVRVEAVQREADGWKGASGFQYLTRELETVGEEAYVPENRTHQVGLFTLQEFDLGVAKAEAAGRYERSNVRSDVAGFDEGYNAFSVSVGGSMPVAAGFRAGLSYTHAERAPAAEELLSFGPHFATQAFEIGDPDLRKERSDGIEGTLRGRGEGWRADFAVFHTRFSNFIFLEPTGEEEDELPVFLYRQDRARFTGIEFDGDLRLWQEGTSAVRGTLLFDWVRASLSDGEAAPLIPPFRVLAGIEGDWRDFGGRVELEHATAQDRVAEFELPTDGWTMVNLAASWRPFGRDNATLVSLSLNNLFDVDARRHASVIKDFAPLAGRDVRLSARFSF